MSLFERASCLLARPEQKTDRIVAYHMFLVASTGCVIIFTLDGGPLELENASHGAIFGRALD